MNWMEWEDYMLKINLIQYNVDKLCRDSREKICVAWISDVKDVLLCCAGFLRGWRKGWGVVVEFKQITCPSVLVLCGEILL